MIHYKDLNLDRYNDALLSVGRSGSYVKRNGDRATRNPTRRSEAIYTFDIETTSFFKDSKGDVYSFEQLKEKHAKDDGKLNDIINKNYTKGAYSYIWMFSIDDLVIYGRTLPEFVQWLKEFTHKFMISFDVYIHNLSYEFQFIRQYFDWFVDGIFARSERKPMFAKTNLLYDITDKGTKDATGVPGNVTFRDSLVLAGGAPLAKIPKLFGLTINKKEGQLDYGKLRHHTTPLTDEELEYCEYDCLVLYEYIKHERKEHKKTGRRKMPITSTGKIRGKHDDEFKKSQPHGLRAQRQKTASMAPNLDTYLMLRESFAGGYTHANANWTGQILKGVQSYDLKSDYPSQMIFEKYPMQRFVDFTRKINKYTPDELIQKVLKLKDEQAAMVTLTFRGLRSTLCNNYISFSKCKAFGETLDNGRIISADVCTTTCTELDLEIITQAYEWDSVTVDRLMSAKKEYLPIETVNVLIDLFKSKEEIGALLKKDPDNLDLMAQYNASKSFINSMFGMSVTNNISDTVTYFDEWGKIKLTEEKLNDILDEAMTTENPKDTMPYAWGVWITAYARHSLWQVILKMDYDVVYCDTDSVKGFFQDHQGIIEDYNNNQKKKIEMVSKERDLPIEYIANLGMFEMEGFSDKSGKLPARDEYDEFVTLGAKKYAYRYPDGLHITVSGVPKKGATCLKDDISNFNKDFTFGYEAGRNLSFHDDVGGTAEIVDYTGIKEPIIYGPGVCLYPTTYHMTITAEYDALITSRYEATSAEIFRR